MTGEAILIGRAPEGFQSLSLKRTNRHGLIAGATGTGKTVKAMRAAAAQAKIDAQTAAQRARS